MWQRKKRASRKKSVPRKEKAQTSSRKTSAQKTKEASRGETCAIVGIGASAGGLDATRRFFDAMPDDPGLAVVVIQHLDPSKKSYTPELLVKHTAMQVTEVCDDPVVKPNRVYVIPPGKYLSIAQGVLHLSEPDEPRGQRRAIDFFLRSLAEDQKRRAVGVILSGTGTDGTLGIKAIKQRGGMVIAQDPATAGFDSMPRSAVNTGVVDYVLPPEQIPETLVLYARHPYVCEEGSAEREDAEEALDTEPAESKSEKPAGLGQILALLRTRTRHDFQNYKENTIIRRTHRRMCLLHLNDYADYLDYLHEHPAEVLALVKDLLISVTDFFRDPEAWGELQPLLRELISGKEPEAAIRVWVPGCATGEEAYTLAMLIMEELEKAKKPCPVQVFASDIDNDALEYARHGRYPASIEADVSPERFARFFTSADGSEYYRVDKALREAVVFADQNLIADPPFSKLDLICCRNVLIYLKPEVQDKIIAMFHFALVEGGILFLGSSETVGRHKALFETIHKRWRIYRRVGPTRYDQVEIPVSAASGPRHRINELPVPGHGDRNHLAHLAQQYLLDWLAPQAILVDRSWRMLYLSGELDRYLSRGPGVPNDHLLENCRRGLRTRLRSAVHEALNEKQAVSVVAKLQRNNQLERVRITVRPIPQRDDLPELALVVFEPGASEDVEPAGKKPLAGPDKPTAAEESRPGEQPRDMELDEHAIFKQLEDELASTRTELQAAVEQLETSNEEYKAANEEVMSINEELQSTNEELETSKEELQSLNEELSTVNNQLSGKVEELETKHADLKNLISVTDVATVCLDTDLCIRWFTPASKTVIRLSDTDQGRPISDFAHDFVDSDLVAACRRVLDKLIPEESEVECRDHRYYVRRITPYRTDDHRIGGLVTTYVDITSRKQFEQQLQESELRLRRAAESAEFGTYDIQPLTGVVHWSPEMKQLYGLPRDADVPVGPLEVPPQVYPEDREKVRKAWEAATDPKGDGRLSGEHRVALASGEIRWVMFRGLTYFEGEGESRRAVRAVGTALDVTQRKQAELELQKLNASLEEEVARRVATLALLQEITVASNEAKIFREAVCAALARICEYNGWVVGHAWEVSEENPEELVSLRAWYVSDEPQPETARRLEEFQRITEQIRIPIGGNFVGHVARTGEPAWLEDVDDFPDWSRGNPGKFGLASCIAFPILIDNHVAAVLEFYAHDAIRREEQFMEIMSNIGIQLGHAFQRQLLERAIDAATTKYQRYIAQELHDSVAQELTGCSMMAEVLREKIVSGDADEDLAEKLQFHLRAAGEEVRRLSHGLMPVVVDAEGLMRALEDLAGHAREWHSLQCEFHCEAPVAVENADVATHFYRIAQEALQNAAKHSRADHVDLTLRREGDDVVLLIQDNGKGVCDPKSSDGQGLQIMRHRANLIGGEFDIRSSDGEGVTITCRVRQAESQTPASDSCQ